MSEVEVAVGVVIPMYQASGTIDATLASVCAQTYRNLEIVVVDDGSQDGSQEIVEGWVARDRRIRLVRQPNAGVAAARNAGAAEVSADVLAFLDADDLWAPEKIALQIQALRESVDTAVLIYCLFVQIDGDSRIYPPVAHHGFEGDVLRRLCRANFVGNGSSMLMTRSVFDRVGGFDSSLRANNAQGCEDMAFLIKAAESHPFRLVPRHLVGYRLTHDNMSSDTQRMLKSFDLVRADVLQRQPQFLEEFSAHRRDFLVWLALRATMAGRLKASLPLLVQISQTSLTTLFRCLPDTIVTLVRSKLVPRWLKSKVAASRRRPLYQDVSW